MQKLVTTSRNDAVSELCDFIHANQPVMVLTGAGCSTESGIPDYRDLQGKWKHKGPVQYLEFINDLSARKRYWSRSMLGWQRIEAAEPNAAHCSLARLEDSGFIQYLVTQNVDGLHRRAGSKSMLELHGGLAWVICLECGHRVSRSRFQEMLTSCNRDFDANVEGYAPDGDARIEEFDGDLFQVPGCPACDGLLKPDVVFFGETVPRIRVDQACRELDQAAAMLVVGSSLMVYSGYRFCLYARKQGKSIAILNLGRTRADDEAQLKLELTCGATLQDVAGRLIA